MKHPFATAMLTGALLGAAAALAQSTTPTGLTAQPSAVKTTSQSSQVPNSPPIQANHTSQAATTPAQGAAPAWESLDTRKVIRAYQAGAALFRDLVHSALIQKS
jgi:hypothetical protein